MRYLPIIVTLLLLSIPVFSSSPEIPNTKNVSLKSVWQEEPLEKPPSEFPKSFRISRSNTPSALLTAGYYPIYTKKHPDGKLFRLINRKNGWSIVTMVVHHKNQKEEFLVDSQASKIIGLGLGPQWVRIEEVK